MKPHLYGTKGQKMYDTFHIQRAISVPNWSDANILQNIDIYGPYACFAYSHIIGGHKKPEKVTRSHCYGRFIGRKSPQNTLFLTFFCATCKIVFLFGLLQTIQIKIKINLKKNLNIHVHGTDFPEKLES